MSEWMKRPPNNPYDNWWVVDEEGTPLAGCRDEAAANRVILDHELAALAEETRAAIVSNTSSAADAWHTFCVRYDYCALKAQAKAREVLSKDSCSRCGHSEHPLLRCDSCGTNGSRCTPARQAMTGSERPTPEDWQRQREIELERLTRTVDKLESMNDAAEARDTMAREQCAHQRIEDCPATVVGTCKTCGKPYCRYHAKEHGGAHQGSKS